MKTNCKTQLLLLLLFWVEYKIGLAKKHELLIVEDEAVMSCRPVFVSKTFPSSIYCWSPVLFLITSFARLLFN